MTLEATGCGSAKAPRQSALSRNGVVRGLGELDPLSNFLT